MNNSNDIFLKQMRGVKPIKKNNRFEKEKINTKQIKSTKECMGKKMVVKISKTEKGIKKPEFMLESLNIKKSIKKGIFRIDKKIDFHGKTLFESEELFSKAIKTSYNQGLRCLLFITGKGLFKAKKFEEVDKPKLYYGVIRSALKGWAESKKFSKYILSYESASIEHGGDGAFYIYLRKKKTNFIQA